nr:GerAB/ArcD/ProY family transporter [Paenibacillus phyllosphaerae]
MALAVVIGTAMTFMYTYIMGKFPGLGMPEILDKFLPKMVVKPIMVFMAAMWIIGPSIALVSYAVLINRFINPDTSPVMVLILLSGVCIYAATRSTLTLAFLVEMGMLINFPIILFILLKAVRSDAINWDAIRTVANYWTQMPNLQSVGAASYIFTGYVSFAIYNRLMPPNIRIRHRWIIPISGSAILLLTFFVPIGFHGTEAVENYLYVWSVTADSLMMNYGFIERVIFMFLIMYLNLTLIYTASGWHQAIEFLKALSNSYKPSVDDVPMKRNGFIYSTVIALLTVIYLYYVNEKTTFAISGYWLSFRMFIEIGTVVTMFIFARKGTNSS